MKLEDVVRNYGFNDYYEMMTGRTFHLSEVKNEPDGLVEVPVSENGVVIGYVNIRKGE